MSLGKCKLKQQRGVTPHLVKWPKSWQQNSLRAPNVGKDVELQFLFVTYGNVKWYSNFGRQFDSLLYNLTYSYLMIQQWHSEL